MIRKAFHRSHKLFIPFMMAGYPNECRTIEAIMALSRAGADIIELGLPFSDPIADGEINQKAAEHALKNGFNIEKYFNIIKTARVKGCDKPILIFSYFNPIHAMGIETFFNKAQSVGANGVLIVDLPPEEGQEVYKMATLNNLEIVMLVSPTTEVNRIKSLGNFNPAFIYYISRLGVTGISKEILYVDIAHDIERVRPILPHIPICVGFGISTAHQASKVAKFADGVVVGSQLVRALQEGTLNDFETIAYELATSIHKNR